MSKDTQSIEEDAPFSKQTKNKIAEALGENAAKLQIPISPILVPFYGDWENTAFIHQLLYWQERATKTGGWVCKTYEEWGNELSIDKQKIQRIVKKFTASFLEKGKPKMFNGKKRTRLRVNISKHLLSIEHYLSTTHSKVSN